MGLNGTRTSKVGRLYISSIEFSKSLIDRETRLGLLIVVRTSLLSNSMGNTCIEKSPPNANLASISTKLRYIEI